MRKEINLISFPYFRKPARLEKLNHHIKLHPDFMMHQISGATGCSQNDAFGILLLLNFSLVGDLKLIVYHEKDLETPMFIRNFSEGPPQMPIVNPLNDEEIKTIEELRYDFMLKLKENVQLNFVFEQS